MKLEFISCRGGVKALSLEVPCQGSRCRCQTYPTWVQFLLSQLQGLQHLWISFKEVQVKAPITKQTKRKNNYHISEKFSCFLELNRKLLKEHNFLIMKVIYFNFFCFWSKLTKIFTKLICRSWFLKAIFGHEMEFVFFPTKYHNGISLFLLITFRIRKTLVQFNYVYYIKTGLEKPY